MPELKEAVFIDGIRTPNARAHEEKGYLREKRPDDLLAILYRAMFKRNPKIKPTDIECLFIGTANPSGMQNDIGRLAWIAEGLPVEVPSQTIQNQCPSGMSATMDACRSVMTGEHDIVLAGGVEDMNKVPMAANMDFPPNMMKLWDFGDIPMGATAEKVAAMYKVSKEDQTDFAIYSNAQAAKARNEGKFKNEIIPVPGKKEDGTEFLMEHDQWIRDKTDRTKMLAMDTPFKPGGSVTAATSSPLTAGAALLLIMSRQKADQLGLSYTYKYSYGSQAGCDPTVMGIGPIDAAKRLFAKTGLTPKDIGAYELNEAFASQALACIRELKIDNDKPPYTKVNTWGGAMALGHPLGESGARLVVTLMNRMKVDYPNEKYGMAFLCGGFGNANAILIEKVKK